MATVGRADATPAPDVERAAPLADDHPVVIINKRRVRSKSSKLFAVVVEHVQPAAVAAPVPVVVVQQQAHKAQTEEASRARMVACVSGQDVENTFEIPQMQTVDKIVETPEIQMSRNARRRPCTSFGGSQPGRSAVALVLFVSVASAAC